MTVIVENITKSYGNQLALNNVSFRLNKGEITGFLGPNGAGKSTMMKIIAGFIAPASGSVTINAIKVDVTKNNFQTNIGYLPEATPLYPEMYIREYLQMIAGIYQLKNSKIKIDDAIELTGLSIEAHKKIGSLSKGYKQRVGLAQALIHNPEFLILDEPTSGLDPNQLEEIRNMIVTISKEKTVLLSTHIMQEVEAICDRVIIINKGILVADKPISELNKISSSAQQVIYEIKEPISSTLFNELPFISNVTRLSDNRYLIESNTENDIRPMLYNFTIEQQLTLLTLQEKENSIEHIFRKLTV